MGKRSIPRKFILRAAVAALSTAVTVLAIDLAAFYLLDIKKPGYRPERFFQFSPLTGHRYRPNSEGWWYRYDDGTKYRVRINSHGFADAPRERRKTRPRIALLGDSTMAFWETEEAFRGQFVIEDLLGNKAEVLNFGVRGFGTDQTCLLFEREGVHFSPDIVIYMFCINDIHDNLTREAKPYFVRDSGDNGGLILKGCPVPEPGEPGGAGKGFRRSLSRSVLDRSFILRRLMVFFRKALRKNRVPLDAHFELRPYKKIYDEEDTRGLDITTRLIFRLNQTARAKEMKFLLVEGIYRPAVDRGLQEELIEAYGDRFDFSQISRRLGCFAEKNGIAFLSLPEAVEARQAPVRDLMHREDYIHLNREGIRFFSHAVAEKLKALGWLEGPVD